MYCERVGMGKLDSSDKPRIRSFGPNVRSHSRHFLQQSEYTIAVQYLEGEWWFKPHEEVFAAEMPD